MTDSPRPAVILVVDDDAAVRQVTARVLEREGYRVLQAEGGREALSMAGDPSARLDLLLTDVVMPGMNGRELGEAMVRLRPGTRLLYMSGYPEDEILRRGIAVSEVAFLHKPFSLTGLTTAVRRALED